MINLFALGLLAALLSGCAGATQTAGAAPSTDSSAAAAAAMMGYHGPLREEDKRDGN
jgi:hypothetical protein